MLIWSAFTWFKKKPLKLAEMLSWITDGVIHSFYGIASYRWHVLLKVCVRDSLHKDDIHCNPILIRVSL